jgi:hypothetical protein
MTINGYRVQTDEDLGFKVAVDFWQCNCATDTVHRRSVNVLAMQMCRECRTDELDAKSPSIHKCIVVGARFRPPSYKLARIWVITEVAQ